MESARKETNNWVIKVNQELEKMVDPLTETQMYQKRSIYKLPCCITELNQNAYEPQAVSFGPYHHNKPRVRPMEEHKRRALASFLKRSSRPLSVMIESVAEVVQEIKDSYHPLDLGWEEESGEFLKMVILDGCFVLEVLYVSSRAYDEVCGYGLDDPVFSRHGELHIMPFVRRDMVLVENQLPMLVLERLVDPDRPGSEKGEYLNALIQKFLSPGGTALPLGPSLHILDVFRKTQINKGPTKLTRQPSRGRGTDQAIIRSATELAEAGIHFKKSKTRSLRDISFCNGVLRLPTIVVDDSTESNLLNLVAFERLHVGAGTEVTSYVFFMDNIVDSDKDIALLHDRGIIQNAIGSDRAAADLFNSLSRDTTLDPESKLGVVHDKVNGYCRKRRNKWRANLCHTYFRSPWAIVSLVAAVLLFALTIVQTYYTIYAYYNPGNDSGASPPPNPAPPSAPRH